MKVATLKQIGFVVVAFLWSLDLPAQPLRPAEPVAPKTAYEELVHVRMFAFGPVSYGGYTSPGEIAFRSIMGTSNALQVLSRVLTNGTPEAKPYVLCGIRQLAPETFENAAKLLVTSNPKVEMMRGCFFWQERASNVVGRIRLMRKDSYEDVNARQNHRERLYPLP